MGEVVQTVLDAKLRESRSPVNAEHIITGIVNNFDPKIVTHLFEVNAGTGGGKILACGFNFSGIAPESRYLLVQFLNYSLSEKFLPKSTTTREDLARWVGGKMKKK